MTFRPHRRSLRRCLLALSLLPLVAGAPAAQPSAAAVASLRVVPGLGSWIGHHDFVGFYRALVGGRWVKVYCVRPDRAEPTQLRLRTVSRLPGAPAAVIRELAETLSAHGDARTAVQAAAVSQALNEEIGNSRAVARRARQLPQAVRALAARYVAEARERRAPYVLAVHLPTSPLPGQDGTGYVSLRSAAGGVSGTVMLRHTANVQTPEVLHAGRSGRASFRYRTVGAGPVHIAATAEVPPLTLRASTPTATTQLMLTWSPPATARASATYQAAGPGFGHRYACTNTCNGRPRVVLTACAPANRAASRLTYWFGGQTHRISFAAADRRVCASWSVRLHDGVSVSATWQYRTTGGWTRPLPADGWFTVDCPPAPPVAVALGYDCAAATLAVVLGRQRGGALLPLRNRTMHRMVLVVLGAVTGRFELAPGATATVSEFSVGCGSHATVTVCGGVQRAAGTYNYGQPVTVTLP
jgi:hypothetical protein